MIRKADINKYLSNLSIRHVLFFSISTLLVTVMMINVMISTALTRRQIRENTYSNITAIIEQSKNNMDFRIYDLYSNFIKLENSAAMTLLQLHFIKTESISQKHIIEVKTVIDNMFYNNYEAFDSIYLNINEQALYKSTKLFNSMVFNYEDWFNKYGISNIHSENYRWEIRNSSPIFEYDLEDDNSLTLFKLIGNQNSHNQGILLFNIKSTYFQSSLNDLTISPHAYAFLLDSSNIFIPSEPLEEYAYDNDVLNYLRNTAKTRGSFDFKRYGQSKMSVIYDTLETTGWKIVYIFPEEDLFTTYNQIRYYNYLSIFILIVFSIVVAHLAFRLITTPILTLTSKMESLDIEKPESNYIEQQGFKEIRILENGIRCLLVRIRGLIKDIEYEKEQEKKLELDILQYQINPHFLYNTLYSITQLIEMNETEIAKNTSLALAEFYRIGLSKGNTIISIKEELKHIERYFQIQQEKYADRMRYFIEVSSTFLKYQIVKLTLQPIVENAIYHGIQPTRSSCTIRITATEVDEENIMIQVSDNGMGIDPNRLDRIKTELEITDNTVIHTTFGLRNVHQRIKGYFGKQYGMTIESTLKKGTTVTIVIPKKLISEEVN